eukprot:9974836-Alexandrium_andersonii.AAC.1
MSASLVGSEMCIRDSSMGAFAHPAGRAADTSPAYLSIASLGRADGLGLKVRCVLPDGAPSFNLTLTTKGKWSV